MPDHFDVLIVGGGHGGAQAALALRQQGFAGSIGLVGEEPYLPYDRPPLSKEYLAGEKDFERMLFRSPDFWTERAVAIRTGARVVAVDPEARQVTTADGAPIAYGEMIWATGGTARRLDVPGADLPGVHSIRSRTDVDLMLAELPNVREVVVIGGGYIGLEAAAVLTKLGWRITVLEVADRVLARVAAEPLARFYEAEHRARGVDIRLSAAVERIVEQDGRVGGVALSGGETLPAQLIVVGIGIDAATGPLAAAGAEMGDGVRIDGQCRTSLPHIFAIGDCAEHRNRFAGGDWVRLESVQNATDQAGIAAKAICGGDATYEAVPWFWSNQYDLKLQTVGLHRGHDRLLVRGDMSARSFALLYLKDGAVIAIDCVNAVKDYVQGRALILSGLKAEPALLADPAISLKSLA